MASTAEIKFRYNLHRLLFSKKNRLCHFDEGEIPLQVLLMQVSYHTL
jgi:hypothetical protein